MLKKITVKNKKSSPQAAFYLPQEMAA